MFVNWACKVDIAVAFYKYFEIASVLASYALVRNPSAFGYG